MSSRSFLLQAADLLADPGRSPGWSYDDPAVLLSTGKLSAHFAAIIAETAPRLEGLADALERDGAAAGSRTCPPAPRSMPPGCRVRSWRPTRSLRRSHACTAR